jgi:hypothetical protein
MIVSVQTDLKSSKIRVFKLEAKTLIVGDSASGKSEITQALELAASGRLSDFQGRVDSAARTVKDHVGSTVELTYATKGVARLRYREVREAVTSSGLSALLALTDGHLDAEATRAVSILKATQRQVKASAEVSRKFASASEVLEGLVMPGGGTTAYAVARKACDAGYSAAELDKDRAKERAAVLVNEIWPAITRTMSWIVELARQFVPPRLGKLYVDLGGPSAPDCTLRLNDRVALSGSEWNIVLTALACAVSVDDTDLVMPDDRAIDLDLLSEWLECLANAQCQVVLTAIYPPDKVDNRWQVLRKQVGSQSKMPPIFSGSPARTSTGSSKLDASRAESTKTAVDS